MIFNRYYSDLLQKYVVPGKVLVLYGARRTGKTWLVNHFLNEIPLKIYRGTGDDLSLRRALEDRSVSRIELLFSGYDAVFFDEAQSIPFIGEVLKLMVDHLPKIRVIVTGSSSFELAHQVGEPLAGRKTTLKLYPLSVLELNDQLGGIWCDQSLETWMIYGMYPEVLNCSGAIDKADYLMELRDSALYKDILMLDSVRNSKKIGDLLRLVAFQVGHEVSHHELATQLGMDGKTVERYLDLLEKAFILIRVRGFSRNLRKEVTKSVRYYFHDNGILNALLENFKPLSLRNDTGMLWENFLFMERLKHNDYLGFYARPYFWRTYDQQEIDLIEESSGDALAAYEFKYQRTKVKPPAAWKLNYPEATFEVVSKDNYLPFLISQEKKS